MKGDGRMEKGNLKMFLQDFDKNRALFVRNMRERHSLQHQLSILERDHRKNMLQIEETILSSRHLLRSRILPTSTCAGGNLKASVVDVPSSYLRIPGKASISVSKKLQQQQGGFDDNVMKSSNRLSFPALPSKTGNIQHQSNRACVNAAAFQRDGRNSRRVYRKRSTTESEAVKSKRQTSNRIFYSS
eukprot:gene10125-11160_t